MEAQSSTDRTEPADSPGDSTQSSGDSEWYEVEGITGERGRKYRVKWKGTDPKTGKPWPQQWVVKSEVTSDAVLEWKERRRRKAKRRKNGPRSSLKGHDQKLFRKEATHVTPQQSTSDTPVLSDDDDDHAADGRAKRARLSATPPASENRVELDSITQTSDYRPTQSFARSSQDPSSPFPRRLLRESSIPFSHPSVCTTSVPAASNPPPRRKSFSVLIERPQGFDPTQYYRLSCTDLVPSTQTDSSNPSTPFTAEATQRSVVIPDSQGFYDQPDFSTFITSSQEIVSQEKQGAVTFTSVIEVPSDWESSLDELVGEHAQNVSDSVQPQGPAEPPTSSEPPPALLQTTTNSAFENHTPLAEATFRTPPPLEPETTHALDTQDEKLEASQEAQRIANLELDLPLGGLSQCSLGDDSFDLDLPQGLDLSYPSWDKGPVAVGTSGGEVSKEAYQEVTGLRITGVEESPYSQEKLNLSSEEPKDPQHQASPRRTTTSPVPKTKSRRRQLLGEASFQDWFRIERNRQRGFSEPPTAVAQSQQTEGFDFPLDAYSEFTDQDFPLPLTHSARMLPAPDPQMARKWSSLREMLAAKRKERDEDMVRRRASGGRDHSAGAPAIPRGSATINTQKSTSAARIKAVKQEMKTEPRSTQSQFHAPHLGPAEYAIPLPLGTTAPTPDGISQKSLYVREIVNKYAEIEAYLEHRGDDAKNVAFDVAKRCARIATHPHIVYPIPLDSEDTKKGADFLAVMSAKFRFLMDLFAVILDETIKVGIVAEAPDMIDMLEVFFRGLKISHKRLDRLSSHKPLPDNEIKGCIQVYLIPSSRGSGIVGTTCHMLIAMDATFDPLAKEVTQIRQDLYDPKKLAPVLRLITVNTIEHAMLCIPPDPALFVYGSVEAIKLLRHEAGMVDPTYAAAIGDAPAKAAAWIKGKWQGEFGIPPLPELPLYDTVALTQTQTQQGGDEHGDKRKRKIQDISESELKKRKLQLSPAGVGDVTHVSNTMPSQSPSQSQSQDYATRPGAPGRQVDDGGEEPMIIDDSETESEPEPELAYKKYARPVQPIGGDTPFEQMTQEELIEEIKTKTVDLKSWMDCQNRLQTNWEEQRETIRKLKLQATESEHAHERELKQIKTKLERALADIDKYKAQIQGLEDQLSQTDALLLRDSPLAHNMLVANVDLTKQVAHLTRKLESTERVAAFAGEQYQAASNASFEMRNEVKALEEANVDLQRRADDNVVKVREAFRDTQVHDRDRRIQELRTQLTQRDIEIKRLQEKVKDAETPQPKRGVPRRVAGAGASPAGSRSSSPSVRK